MHLAVTVLLAFFVGIGCGKRGDLPVSHPWLLLESADPIRATIQVFPGVLFIEAALPITEVSLECVAFPPIHPLGTPAISGCPASRISGTRITVAPPPAALRLHSGPRQSTWLITHLQWAKSLSSTPLQHWLTRFPSAIDLVPDSNSRKAWIRPTTEFGDVTFFGDPVTEE